MHGGKASESVLGLGGLTPPVAPGGAGWAALEGAGVAETETAARARAEKTSLLKCIVSASCSGCDMSIERL